VLAASAPVTPLKVRQDGRPIHVRRQPLLTMTEWRWATTASSRTAPSRPTPPSPPRSPSAEAWRPWARHLLGRQPPRPPSLHGCAEIPLPYYWGEEKLGTLRGCGTPTWGGPTGTGFQTPSPTAGTAALAPLPPAQQPVPRLVALAWRCRRCWEGSSPGAWKARCAGCYGRLRPRLRRRPGRARVGSICHTYGSRPFATRARTNNVLVASRRSARGGTRTTRLPFLGHLRLPLVAGGRGRLGHPRA